MTTLAPTTTIPGYTFDAPDLPKSPLTQAEFDLLRQTVLFTDEDVRYLRMAGDVLADQIEAILDVWYGFVGAHPHLLAYFSTHDGQPIGDYLARVRQRFGQWILDTTRRPYDPDLHAVALAQTQRRRLNRLRMAAKNLGFQLVPNEQPAGCFLRARRGKRVWSDSVCPLRPPVICACPSVAAAALHFCGCARRRAGVLAPRSQ